MPIEYCACFDPCCAWCNALEKAEAERKSKPPQQVVATRPAPFTHVIIDEGEDPDPETRYRRSAEGQAWDRVMDDEDFVRRNLS